MKRVKFVLGCSSLALSLFAAGCGGKPCGDYKDRVECNQAKDKEGQQCHWEEAEVGAKGTCKVKPETMDSLKSQLSEAQAELEKAETKIKTLEKSLKNPAFIQGCMAKNKIELNKVCIFPDNSQNKKRDCEAIAFGKTNLCKYKPTGKCSLQPSASLLATEDSLWSNTPVPWKAEDSLTNVSLSAFKIKGIGGVPVAVLQAAGSTAFSNAFMQVDPCKVYKKKDDCMKGLVDITSDGRSTILLMGDNTFTGVPHLCGWDGGEDDDQCMFDVDALGKIECSGLSQKKCKAADHFCTWGDTPVLKTAPAEGSHNGGDGAGI